MVEKKRKDITRRDFLKKVGQGTAALGVASVAPRLVRPARAARDHILVGRPNPSTGPLASFGEACPWIDDRALEAINKKGGIYVKEVGKKLPLKAKILDTQSNPAKAAELASRMIVKDKIDLMIVLHTPDTVNPVSGMCERYEVPCIALDAPVEPWLTGGPYKWTYMAFWTVDTYTSIEIEMWDEIADRTNKVVGGLWANDADGISWAENFHKKLPPKGYKLIDPGRFPYFNKDFTPIINMFKKEKVEILTGNLIPPDWGLAWKQCHQLGFIPKIATIDKPILFPADVNALGGDLPNGLTMIIWWSPDHPFKSSLTGESARDLCVSWTEQTGKQDTAVLGYKYAGYEIAYDALNRAQTLDKGKIRDAIEKTNLDTMVGPVNYNEKHYSPTPLVGGQWVKGKKWPWEPVVTFNKPFPAIPKTADIIFPLPRPG